MASSSDLSEDLARSRLSFPAIPYWLPLSEEDLSDEEMKECLVLLRKTDRSELYPPLERSIRWGKSLVEVFSVRINNIDKENPGDLYGKIIVNDGLDFQCIYDQSIKPGDNLLLTGPARYISASQNFTAKVIITDKDNEEVIYGQIFWYAFSNSSVYDKPLNLDIVGRHGSVSVNFVPLSVAAGANVEVTRDGEDPANVYGELTATSREFADCKSVLFQKAADESINVSPGQVIPLSRSLVAVPFDSSLVVVANLYDHNTVSSNGEIANGTAEFFVKNFGTFEEQIISGKIRVKVTWMYT